MLVFALILSGCNQNDPANDQRKIKPCTMPVSDTLKNNKPGKVVSEGDSLIVLDDSLFSDMKLVFHEISGNEFQSYKRRYKANCVLDAGHFISGSGLFVRNDCNEICETYLVEKTTNRKMLIPSAYDAGILNMLLSQTCTQFMVCSSYDGPDFEDYYENRAELYLFKILKETGLKGVKPAGQFYTKDWSIEDFTWVSDKAIALKVYEGNGSDANYRYLKTHL
ncbi:MAG: hypothetical protein K0S23_331 [Fluviicola sp.]|nr:hypothetical protein [Fluviicola sp.]